MKEQKININETKTIRNASFNIGIDPAFSVTLQINCTSELDMAGLVSEFLNALAKEIQEKGFGFIQAGNAGHFLKNNPDGPDDAQENDLQKPADCDCGICKGI